MKNVLKKIKIIVFALAISFLIFMPNAYAADGGSTSGPFIKPDDYKPSELTNAGTVLTKGNIIIGGIQFIGSIVSVIALILIGIKFIVGSAEERAEYKESMKPYIIGAILVFSTANLLGIISEIFS